MGTRRLMTTKGQDYSMTFVQGHSGSTLLNFFSSKSTRPFEAKFHMEPPWDVGMKFYSNVSSHITKMASWPIYCKNLKTSSSSEPRGR